MMPTRSFARPCLGPAGLAGLLLATLLPSSPARAFSEDLCIDDQKPLGQRYYNCLEANCGPNAADHSLCRANLVYDAAKAVQTNGRSMMHADATFILAQAVRLRPDVSYWIAAYDEAVDRGQYIQYDKSGGTVPAGYSAPADVVQVVDPKSGQITGFTRTEPTSGGWGYHFPAVFRFNPGSPLGNNPPGQVDGQHPDLGDAVTEAMLYQMRHWGLYGTQKGCIDGFTRYDPVQRTFATGSECFYASDPTHTEPPTLTQWIDGLMPSFTNPPGTPEVLVPFSSYSGDMIVRYVETGTPPVYSDWTFDDALQAGMHALELKPNILDNPTQTLGRIFVDSTPIPVPADLARLAIYLHVLQDRISHYQCADASVVHEPDAQGHLSFSYDPDECTQDYHATRHYEEIGWPVSQLPDRDFSALGYTFDELATFAAQHPAYRLPGPALSDAERAARKAEYVGTRAAPGAIVAGVLTVADACARLKAAIELVHQKGLLQMPGNAWPTTGMCH